MNKTIQILGINFYNDSVQNLLEYLNEFGGFLTAPSGPGLSIIPNQPIYYEAVKSADIVIADSGLMVLLWRFLENEKVNRISGLEFINGFLPFLIRNNQKTLFLVNPNGEEEIANINYLEGIGIKLDKKHSYIAPFYQPSKIEDSKLLAILEAEKPHWIMLNIGGGTQEVLGAWLSKNLSYKPAILCIGAAIAFKTGKQVQIPAIIDKYYLGWLWRSLSNPKVYGKRFWEARSLASLILRYKEKPVK